jgi:Flp pilus assembly protein protease CpaA
MSMQAWIAMIVGAAAVIDDLSRRHIANWIPAAALAGGFGWQIGTRGAAGAWSAAAGTLAGFAVFLIFFLLGGMGGGDVKLMAGFGALLGPGQLLSAALWTGAIGGIFALGAIGWKAARGALGIAGSRARKSPVQKTGWSGQADLSGKAELSGQADLSGEADLSKEAQEREASIPYAPAIALGVWISLAVRG